jgi:hypothetical protein
MRFSHPMSAMGRIVEKMSVSCDKRGRIESGNLIYQPSPEEIRIISGKEVGHRQPCGIILKLTVTERRIGRSFYPAFLKRINPVIESGDAFISIHPDCALQQLTIGAFFVRLERAPNHGRQHASDNMYESFPHRFPIAIHYLSIEFGGVIREIRQIYRGIFDLLIQQLPPSLGHLCGMNLGCGGLIGYIWNQYGDHVIDGGHD